MVVQGGWGGCRTGNGKKLSKSQACCLAQLCLAVAYFFPFPVGHPPHPPCTYHCLIRNGVTEKRDPSLPK